MEQNDVKNKLQDILTPELCLAVYRLKFPYGKGELPSGAVIGQQHFKPSQEYIQAAYDLIVHDAILPMSELPLEEVLKIDLTEFLPGPTAPEYPEHCLGMITLIDQSRVCAKGYGMRYMRAFFDPICEKLVRQLVALPDDVRPDGKQAWLSRGYTIEDWLVVLVWFLAPLVHSDDFMTVDRQRLKDWLHSVRAEVESHAGASDPFAPLEAEDDLNVNAFQEIEAPGPPLKSYIKPGSDATVADYAFWWIRILNSHFAITDMCGHYPYWIRYTGLKWTDKDREFMTKTGNFRYDPAEEPILEEIRQDYLDGVWKSLQPNPEYEKQPRVNRREAAPGGPVYRKRILGERGHGPRVRGAGSSGMPP